MNKKPTKCNMCGKFIKYEAKNRVEYTPDTEYTIEETIFTCPKCLQNEEETKEKKNER